MLLVLIKDNLQQRRAWLVLLNLCSIRIAGFCPQSTLWDLLIRLREPHHNSTSLRVPVCSHEIRLLMQRLSPFICKAQVKSVIGSSPLAWMSTTLMMIKAEHRPGQSCLLGCHPCIIGTLNPWYVLSSKYCRGSFGTLSAEHINLQMLLRTLGALCGTHKACKHNSSPPANHTSSWLENILSAVHYRSHNLGTTYLRTRASSFTIMPAIVQEAGSSPPSKAIRMGRKCLPHDAFPGKESAVKSKTFGGESLCKTS